MRKLGLCRTYVDEWTWLPRARASVHSNQTAKVQVRKPLFFSAEHKPVNQYIG